MQNILIRAYKYSLNWGLKFNAGKPIVLRFTPSPPHNDSPASGFLGTEAVYLSNTHNHLSIHFIQNLSILRKSIERKDDKPTLLYKYLTISNQITYTGFTSELFSFPSCMAVISGTIYAKSSAKSEHTSAFNLQTCNWPLKEYQIQHMQITRWASLNNIWNWQKEISSTAHVTVSGHPNPYKVDFSWPTIFLNRLTWSQTIWIYPRRYQQFTYIESHSTSLDLLASWLFLP